MQTHSFAETINRARAAVLSRAATSSATSAAPDSLTRWQAQTRAENQARAASLPRLEALTARAGLSLPAPTVQPTRRAACPDLADLVQLDTLKAGPRRLLASLHSLGVGVVAARGYACTPNQVTFHLSQELLALALACTTRSVQKWQADLEARGHIEARAHFGGSKHAARVDGLLIAVSLKPGHRARLHHDDLSHQWRDLDADRQAGKTAWAALKYLRSQSEQNLEARTNQVLQLWAVTSSFTKPPLLTDCERPARTVQDVVYTLPLLADLAHQHRPALVSRLSDALARALNDHHSRAWYARLIWEALQAEDAGTPALAPLASMLARLDVDRREWTSLRNPAALFAARLRVV